MSFSPLSTKQNGLSTKRATWKLNLQTTTKSGQVLFATEENFTLACCGVMFWTWTWSGSKNHMIPNGCNFFLKSSGGILVIVNQKKKLRIEPFLSFHVNIPNSRWSTIRLSVISVYVINLVDWCFMCQISVLNMQILLPAVVVRGQGQWYVFWPLLAVKLDHGSSLRRRSHRTRKQICTQILWRCLQCCVNTSIGNNTCLFHFLQAEFASTSACCVNGASGFLDSVPASCEIWELWDSGTIPTSAGKIGNVQASSQISHDTGTNQRDSPTLVTNKDTKCYSYLHNLIWLVARSETKTEQATQNVISVSLENDPWQDLTVTLRDQSACSLIRTCWQILFERLKEEKVHAKRERNLERKRTEKDALRNSAITICAQTGEFISLPKHVCWLELPKRTARDPFGVLQVASSFSRRKNEAVISVLHQVFFFHRQLKILAT